MEELQQRAHEAGLWNMFLPDPEYGAGLSNGDYAPLAEILGRSHIASEACNCSAPDTGNMEVLHQFATPEQKDRWLMPLLDGEIRSAFAMTEPDVASSDATNIAMRIAGDGDGFMIAQARLGPGRIHHCMRAIGAAERALESMCRRAVSRVTFGQPVAMRGNIQDWIAESRIEIEMARLLTLKAAWMMDTVGNRQARTEIAAIKVAAPNAALKVVDRAIQVHGGGGVSDDFHLAWAYAHLRTLRLADGPDEVHKLSIARRELSPHIPRDS